MKDRRSFFEKLTGSIRLKEDSFEDEEEEVSFTENVSPSPARILVTEESWEEEEEGQIAVDVYETEGEIIIKSIVGGVRPEDLDISIGRQVVTIKGKRETEKNINEEDYVLQELYWGSFSRTVTLPAEVDVEESEAVERHGLLIIRMPKVDIHRQTKLKVKG